MFLDQKHLFLDTSKRIHKKPNVKGEGVNPYDQPDHKISGFFYNSPILVQLNLSNSGKNNVHSINDLKKGFKAISHFLS